MDLVDDVGRARTVILALAAARHRAGAPRHLAVPPRRRRSREPHPRNALALHDVLGSHDARRGPPARIRARGPRPLAAGRARRLVPFAAVLLTFTRGAYVGICAAAAPLPRRPAPPRPSPAGAGARRGVLPRAAPRSGERIRSIGDLSDRTNRDRIAMAAGRRPHRERLPGLRPRAGHGQALLPAVPGPGRAALDRAAPAQQRGADRGGERPLRGRRFTRLVGLPVPRARGASGCGANGIRSVRPSGRERCSPGPRSSWPGLFEYNFGDTEVEMATLLVFALPFSRAAGGAGD